MAIRVRRRQENEQAMGELMAIAAAPNVDWIQRLDRHTRGVAEAMNEIHGGHWNISISHETCCVLISRRIDRQQSR